jgi:hypothetical protein
VLTSTKRQRPVTHVARGGANGQSALGQDVFDLELEGEWVSRPGVQDVFEADKPRGLLDDVPIEPASETVARIAPRKLVDG